MAKINISTEKKCGKISKYIYGQFAEHLGRCIYEGIYVGEDSEIENINGMRCDVVNALKELDIPVLRWPGGCFADDYHWRDGIGPKEDRPYMVNTNWGKVVENNHFGTHEYFELVEQLGTEAYICGNVGSGTVKEMRDWVEYMTFAGDSPLANERRKNGRDKPWKLKFFGVGNENWGCGGNMRAEYYADEFRRYSTFIRDYGEEPLYKIAGGPDKADTHWMEVLMQQCANSASGISVHNYTLTYTEDWNHKGDSLSTSEEDYFLLLENALHMDEVVSAHEEVMDKYDAEKKISMIVDEWGNWFDVIPGTNPGFLYQQNTIRDAVTAMIVLHIFHKHCDRIYMANIAQMVNVLQAMILTEGEKMVKTPTYYLFKMMKDHMDAERVELSMDSASYTHGNIPKISADASVKNGKCLITVCNTSLTDDETITMTVDKDFSAVSAVMMRAPSLDTCNDFEHGEVLVPEKLDVTNNNGTLTFTMPKTSVAAITLE